MADIDKVKRNIKRLIDGGAPTSDIERYLAAEGVTRDQLVAPAAGASSPSQGQPPQSASGLLKSLGAGAVRGVASLGGMKGDISDLIGAGLGKLEQLTGLPSPPEGSAPQMPLSPRSSDLVAAAEGVTGPLYEPQTRAEKYTRTIGEFLPNAIGGPANLGRRLMTRTVAPALGSEAAGQATEGTAAEPYARLAGAMAGATVPTALRRAATPFPNSPERQAMVDTLAREGVTPTAGQRTGRQRLQAFEQEMGGHAFDRAQSRVNDEFTQAVLRRAGIVGTRATPDVVNQAFTRIGREFDGLAARTQVPLDQQLQNDLLATVTDYQQVTGQVAPVVENMMNRIAHLAGQNGGVLEGRAYQNIRSKMGEFVRSADGPTQMALREMQEALDDAVERHMSQADRIRWQNARRQYRNILVIERAATGAGSEAAMGAISPARLRQAAVGQNRRAYVRGTDDYSELGHAGQALINVPPRSGTPERLAVRGIPAAIGGVLGGQMGGPGEIAMGAFAGSALPYALGRTALSGPMQRYLSNQRFPTGNQEALRRALATGVLYGPRMLGPPAPQP